MQIDGHNEFAAPPAAVFRAITDPELVADALPGVGRVDVADANHWSAQVAVPFMARSPRLRFEFTVVDRDEPSGVRLEVIGKTLGASIRIDTAFQLNATEAGTTTAYKVDVRAGGLLARIPDSALEPLARRLVSGFLASIDRNAQRELRAASP